MDYTRKFKPYDKNKVKLNLIILIRKYYPEFKLEVTDILKIRVIDKELSNTLDGADFFIFEFAHKMPRLYIKGSPYVEKEGIELADAHAFVNKKGKYREFLWACIGTEQEFFSKPTEFAKAKFLLDGLVFHIIKSIFGSNLVPTKPHGLSKNRGLIISK